MRGNREEDEDIFEALSARRGFEAREYRGKRGTDAIEVGDDHIFDETLKQELPEEGV